MVSNRTKTLALLAIFLGSQSLYAAEQRGLVESGGFPVPGAAVKLFHGATKLTTFTDASGQFRFSNLVAGEWHVRVDMPGFVPVDRDIKIEGVPPEIKADLRLLPLNEALALVEDKDKSLAHGEAQSNPRSETTDDNAGEQESANSDSLLINGSSNNAATSKFTLEQAFGNQRKRTTSLFTGTLGFHFGNSVLDAKPYSITGFELPKSNHDRITGFVTLGGPLFIPHLLPHGPNFSLIYQWRRNSEADALSGLVPTAAQRSPAFAVDPVSVALLALYPLPNISEMDATTIKRQS